MRIALYPNFQKKNALSCAKRVCDILINADIKVSVDNKYHDSFSEFPEIEFMDIKSAAAISDIVIAIGGDGTMLRCAKHLAGYDTQLLGINTGRLLLCCKLSNRRQRNRCL